MSLNEFTKYLLLGTSVLVTSTLTVMGLRCLASTIVYETVALLTKDMVSLVKISKLVIRAIVYFSLALVFLLVSIKISLADFVTGKDLLGTCAAKDVEHHIACVGYIGGVSDAYLHSGQFCIPVRTDPREISSSTIDFILRTRSIQGESAVQMIILALKARWPCLTRGPGFGFRFEIR